MFYQMNVALPRTSDFVLHYTQLTEITNLLYKCSSIFIFPLIYAISNTQLKVLHLLQAFQESVVWTLLA